MPIAQRQRSLLDVSDISAEYEKHIVNLVRREVKKWRETGYPETTRVTKELLSYWFNPQRINKLFFAQREAIETTIWLNEIAEKSNIGQHVINGLQSEWNKISTDKIQFNLPRIAFKMATGTGKTVVMAMQLLYHYFNRQEYRGDTRFADYFLIVAPGITIRDRLSVLYADADRNSERDYYHLRDLVPRSEFYQDLLLALNSRLIVTNRHSFELRALQGNKRSPLDGKKGRNKREATEDYNQMIRRVIGKFKTGTRLLVINDEGHHCYLPKNNGAKKGEDVSKEENERAAVWVTGLAEISQRYKIRSVYDLSATPYYLQGSGYESYTLFPWVVSDFGLVEAIESGLVKIPFLPEEDPTHELEQPKLANLYEHVKKDLPNFGAKHRRLEGRPDIPPLIQIALEQLYTNYFKEYERYRGLFDHPPVFIIVCNNTNVSSEVFKYIAGYELTNADGTTTVVNGKLDLFDNYDKLTRQPLLKPPTLLIDSDALENSDQIDEQFKKVFAPEINRFKSEYRILHPDKSVEKVAEADILREVVNTVGKVGMLGSHIRCVVSVSMLTEGWDANTVTHILGIRAFGSQLLCEQVVGRALRRVSYVVGKDGKFTSEYAQVAGVPFTFFKKGKVGTPVQPEKVEQVYAMPERDAKYEITFPNLTGYRIEISNDIIKSDFSKIKDFEIDGSKYPEYTVMANAFSPEKETLTLDQTKLKRKQEVVYTLTKYIINHFYKDDDGNPYFYQFNQLKKVVEEWFDTKLKLIGDAFKNMILYYDPKAVCDHIMLGIYAEQRKTDVVLPVFNHYNKFGSTKYVRGQTTRKTYPTKKSHVNVVVGDTESWEQIAAKTMDEIPEVLSYVKNAFLDFQIPYNKDGKDNPMYEPDFIARCKTKSGKIVNLIVEISGFSNDKEEKKWYVENRWLPAINAVKEKYECYEWHFIEIAGDIRDIKNQIKAKLAEI
ncbi:MAG: DEAD/DEAH box helicase family protein [Bacteroidota bacterium]|nr:DEAD/DEAH box helicase family protein [Bacteroidota bacterium]